MSQNTELCDAIKIFARDSHKGDNLNHSALQGIPFGLNYAKMFVLFKLSENYNNIFSHSLWEFIWVESGIRIMPRDKIINYNGKIIHDISCIVPFDHPNVYEIALISSDNNPIYIEELGYFDVCKFSTHTEFANEIMRLQTILENYFI